jgi:hypothetical protein
MIYHVNEDGQYTMVQQVAPQHYRKLREEWFLD